MLASITYVSTPVEGFDLDALSALWATCIEANRANEITGGLVYLGDQFFQTIEGPDDRIKSLWDKIQADPRHTDVKILMTCGPATRSFAHARMKLVNGSRVSSIRRRFDRTRLDDVGYQEISRTVFRLVQM